MYQIPKPEDYDVSSQNGFLPTEPPLERLPDAYYEPWEYVIKNLQGLVLSRRLRETVDKMDVLSTEHLLGEAQWQRAYSILAFMAHSYIWGGDKPSERVPPSITIPFLTTCKKLELPPVATYAGLVLWNWKPIFHAERMDTLANLDTIETFTGSLDEKWFYLISIAIEAKAGPIVPLMLQAVESARNSDRHTVTECLKTFAERLDELGAMLSRMYDNCDPHVFYHRIRPFLAGSKNMKDAGLPNGIVFDNGGPINKQRYVQFSGGSNAQSSIIQFFDIVLGVEHRPIGMAKQKTGESDAKPKKAAPNFIHEMRQYMPGPHARFLEAVTKVANIRAFVDEHRYDRNLSLAFDACVAMLSAFRDRHIQMVSRYIIIKSAEAKKAAGQEGEAQQQKKKINIAYRAKSTPKDAGKDDEKAEKGTGGTSLIPFLRQARNETGEQAVEDWTRRILNRKRGSTRREDQGEVKQGLATVWTIDNGGLCYH
ncbi:Putative indoleamine 2,3-dioxygenase [Septoria linicola]|uniref:Indoleamine 2,3-dioxygenase n=1 Tax=Septoria linicola TaxID=215465 RepID=A0A9Q9EEF6_9PEZI|nr:putative indoleamine 2,3-dioxygenase [Septoria linicola]USW47820.1 Putative indoleamine 2,3-dioxygenase [Septoria linicola]